MDAGKVTELLLLAGGDSQEILDAVAYVERMHRDRQAQDKRVKVAEAERDPLKAEVERLRVALNEAHIALFSADNYILLKLGETHPARQFALKVAEAALNGDALKAEVEQLRDFVTTLTGECGRLKGENERLRAVVQAMTTACLSVHEIASATYKARNGRVMSIEADDGERCWIVHDDGMTCLVQAAEAGTAILAAPATAYDAELLDAYTIGAEVEATVRQRRSDRRHRWFWAACSELVQSGAVPFSTTEQFIDALKMSCGISELRQSIGGAPYFVPGSISYAKTDEAKFTEFVDKAVALVAMHYGVELKVRKRAALARNAGRAA